MTLVVQIAAFAVGMSLSIRMIAALHGIIDLWYTIDTAYPRVAGRVLGWGAAILAIAWLLERPYRIAFGSGLLVFLVFYLLGGMGGGDVKLMAGFGALLGAGLLLQAALWTAAIGGVIAVGALLWKYLRKRGAPRRADGKPALVEAQAEPDPEQKLREDSIPYAPAITLGVWLSLLLKG